MPEDVFPTCVGVNPQRRSGIHRRPRIPHVRGGEPSGSATSTASSNRIPHVRGGEPVEREAQR